MSKHSQNSLSLVLILAAAIFIVAFALLMFVGEYSFLPSFFMAFVIALLSAIVLYLGLGTPASGHGHGHTTGAGSAHGRTGTAATGTAATGTAAAGAAAAGAMAAGASATDAGAVSSPSEADAEAAAARKAAADAEATKKAADDEAARKAAADAEAAKKAADEEAAKKAADEDAARKAAEEEAERKAAADAEAAKKAAEEEAARKAAADAEAEKKAAEDEAAQAAADAEAARKAADDEAARKAEEDAAARRADAEATNAPAAMAGSGGAGTAEGSGQGTRPTAMGGPRGGQGDDLKEINGVGPKLEVTLNDMGVYHYDQIADWGDDELAWVDGNLEGFTGRASRDEWVPQARILADRGTLEGTKYAYASGDSGSGDNSSDGGDNSSGYGGSGSETSATPASAPAAGTDASGIPDYDRDGVLEGVNEGTRPAGLDSPRGGQADDLKQIKGIGPKLEKLCNTLGFWHFDQVAAWSADEVAWVDANLQGFKGRVTRDEWVSQAGVLASGGETEFSKRVEDGDVY